MRVPSLDDSRWPVLLVPRGVRRGGEIAAFEMCSATTFVLDTVSRIIILTFMSTADSGLEYVFYHPVVTFFSGV